MNSVPRVFPWPRGLRRQTNTERPTSIRQEFRALDADACTQMRTQMFLELHARQYDMNHTSESILRSIDMAELQMGEASYQDDTGARTSSSALLVLQFLQLEIHQGHLLDQLLPLPLEALLLRLFAKIRILGFGFIVLVCFVRIVCGGGYLHVFVSMCQCQ